jgi:peptidoglycan/xylan/chitin deacetylase (PgdA/CDA1 family)
VIRALPNPIVLNSSAPPGTLGQTTLFWSADGVTDVEVHVGGTDGPLFCHSGPQEQKTTGEWVSDGLTFYLQNVSGGLPLYPEHTLATVMVCVTDLRLSRPAAAILMYHRIADSTMDPWSLCVTPDHFAEHMELLRTSFCPMSLREFIRRTTDGTLPSRAVVVTFDDGYRDNWNTARPVLERYDIPGTFFVVSGAIDQRGEYWWDELAAIVLETGSLPAVLALNLDGRDHVWHVNGQDTPRGPLALYGEVYDLVKPLRASQREAVLDRLRLWAGVEPTQRPHYRTLSATELTALSRLGWAEIGAHTDTHAFLPALSRDELRRELEGGRLRLEQLVGTPVTSLAYPYGAYTRESVVAASEAGFRCACTTADGPAGAGTDLFELPRVFVRNWDADQLSARLSEI